MAVKLTKVKPKRVNRVSHANNKTPDQQKPNLQKKVVNGVSVRMTAKEFKTLNKKSRKNSEN